MPSRPSIPTRPSLLARLRSGDSVEGWEEFYRLYGDLLRNFARKSGLTESEAEEVVQETAIGVARNLPGFRYDPKVCSFRTWMLNLARWRIADALRRRGRSLAGIDPGAMRRRSIPADSEGLSSGTPVVERIPDPRPPDFGADWDADWEAHLQKIALERVRDSIDCRQYQIFDLYALKERPAREVATRLGVSVARVYLVKQRVQARLRKELQRIEREAATRQPAPPNVP